MKIAIISDTHGNVANFKKAIGWLNKENINVILLCGDIGSPESFKESLSDFKGDLYGILGNMDKDYERDISDYQELPRIKVFKEFAEIELGGKKFAIIHRPNRNKELAESGKYDVVFYGHTHRPWEEKKGKCRIVNPGELAGQIFKPCFAVYDTETDMLELKILERIS